ncbi:hypothetical protein [Flavobacterium sp.]|jgi:hypothetical protein|uniref:hypothetical protein n=1 Tax=Flavobacterium sp. TaxID=239 RepID=UPI0037C1489D
MKLNEKQINEIHNIFQIAEKFVSKITRKSSFDIGYVKIKNKWLLGFHLELYARNNNKPKHADIQFWIGEVKDFKKETIDLFLEDFEYTEKNGLEIENLKVSEIEKYKLQLYDMVSKNVL